MPRLKEFRFNWSDAWHHTDTGIDTTLEYGNDNSVRIMALVCNKPYIINVDEDALINDLEGNSIKRWDKNVYQRDFEDGDMLHISIKYDDVGTRVSGYNGYPPRFREFLTILHKHGFPSIPHEEYLTEKDVLRSKKSQMHDDEYCSSAYADYVFLKSLM